MKKNKEMEKRGLVKLSNYDRLVKEFDFSENDLRPEEISHKSAIKVHWICAHGHKWVDSPAHRVGENRGCPYCNGSKLWPGFNDFQTKFPELAKEWCYERNEKKPNEILFTTSKEKFWWKCPKCGYEYLMRPHDRGIGHQGCPVCAHKTLSKSREESFGYKFPKLAKQWDYEKNGGKSPFDFYPSSVKKVWWKCEHNHSWEASIATRAQGGDNDNCSICLNKRIVAGTNDLLTKRPEIEKYWDYEKNTILPTAISEFSERKVWWKCEKGHSFPAKVALVVKGKMKDMCPVCSNRVVVKGFNDLATTNPELLKEWDFKKNKESPYETHAFNNKKRWWICKKGHSWQASVHSRAKNNNECPYCSNQKVLKGFNDTATLFPKILKFWDYEKNVDKPDKYVGVHSNKKIFLKCERGHVWKTTISNFYRGRCCPICSNKQVLEGFNDLKTTHPGLVKEWNTERNERKPTEFTHGSNEKVWWKYSMGHEWKATISSRASGSGCPHCAKEKQISLPEKVIFFYIHQHFSDAAENAYLPELEGRELDVFIPSMKLGVEYDGHNWHKSQKSDLKKDELCQISKIVLIRIREESCPIYQSESIKIPCKDIHNNARLLKPAILELFGEINRIFNLDVVPDVDIERDYSKINDILISGRKANSLLSKCPEVAKEWNNERNGFIRPDQVSVSSNKKVWWKCDSGHEWLASVNSRTGKNKSGCPICYQSKRRRKTK